MQPNDMLVVGADFDPRKVGGRIGVCQATVALARELVGLNVIIKVNSILRSEGYDFIEVLHGFGLRVFADLKLTDTPSTLLRDAQHLNEVCPEIVTIACATSGVDGLRAVRDALSPSTELLGWTVPTSFTEEDCQRSFGCSIEVAVLRFTRMAYDAGLDGIVLPGHQILTIKAVREFESLSLNIPAVRLEGGFVPDDDQKQPMLLEQVLAVGATRVIIGRPIVQASDPRVKAEDILGLMNAAESWMHNMR